MGGRGRREICKANLNEINHLEDVCAYLKIILKWIINRITVCKIKLDWLRWQAAMNTASEEILLHVVTLF
jgi:hypothetical protein